MIKHVNQKDVGYMDVLPNSIRGKHYYIVVSRDPAYVMLTMMTYGALNYLEGSDMKQRYKELFKEVLTKRCNY